MNNETTIRKIIDELLLNIDSISSSGLYNGKAGVALALFEAAKYLQDKEIEDKAFDFLQEALIRNKNDYSFENGLSGVGYVLIYLITNKFIDADFDEIFKEDHEMIIKNFESIDKQPNKLLSSLKIVYFLSVLKDIHQDDIRINQIIEKIFQGVELYLSLQFFDWKNINYINNKTLILQTFETYLELINFTRYTDFSYYLMSSYAELYRSGRVGSSLPIGYYLGRITKQNNILQYSDIINSNISNGMKNIHLNLLALDEKINLIKIVEKCNIEHSNFRLANIDICREGFNKIRRTIRPNHPPFGYQYGLARYLICCLNKKDILI